MDTGTFLRPETQTVIHCQPHVTGTGYLCTVCFIFLSQSHVIKQTVSFALMKSSYIFSQHRLIRTMDTFLSPETQTVIYCQPHFMDTGNLYTFLSIFLVTIMC